MRIFRKPLLEDVEDPRKEARGPKVKGCMTICYPARLRVFRVPSWRFILQIYVSLHAPRIKPPDILNQNLPTYTRQGLDRYRPYLRNNVL